MKYQLQSHINRNYYKGDFLNKFIFLITIICGLSAFSDTKPNLNKNGVILEGYDAVSYFTAKEPLKGSAQFQTKIGEATYWFSSIENKNIFLKDPKKYSPEFDGWCAYAVADSKSKVEIDPKSFLIQDGRLLVFYNGLWGDTRKKWTTDKKKTQAAFLTEADKNWPTVKTTEP